MEGYITISTLNDFIFCPMSIYFHNLYESNDFMYQDVFQIEGKQVHNSIDNKTYSSRNDILKGLEVYSIQYNICGKIDLYFQKERLLMERKKKIINVYDGYIFQLYAQYFCLLEMGYEVYKIKLYSYDDNKSYKIALPSENYEMLNKFERTLEAINTFLPDTFIATNSEKCKKCIYEPLCDRAYYD